MAYNQTDPNTQPPQGRMSGFPEMKEVSMSIYKYRELKQRRRHRERQKSNRFRLANNNFARAHAFLYISQPSLHDYDVKVPNFTFCRGREHNFLFLFLNLDRVP